MPPVAAELAARAAASAVPGRDEGTEVHIHIGRIEVTAVREAAAPRARRPAAQAPTSLDAYLAARSRT